MRLLVLGGTAWLSGTIAIEAVRRGHEVTCLARGETGSAPEGADFVRADRDQLDAYDDVTSTRWDAVVDVSRQPGHVRRAVAALSPGSDFFVFVSSGNAYADHSTPDTDESAAIRSPLQSDVMEDMETYGEAKVACEFAVTAAYGAERSAIVRSGLIGGPGDVSDRSGYWPLRFARPSTDDGSVLVPRAPGLMTQLIDVRDLAAWIVTLAERRRPGIFNATGETRPLSEHLEAARRVAGHTGQLIVVDEEWLVEHKVEHWMGERSLAHWLPLPEYAGFSTRDSSAARSAGLITRPLEQTLADTLAWELDHDPDRLRRSGLSASDERELIAAATGQPN
jgi:2'-hydroxyisoflavone reductase